MAICHDWPGNVRELINILESAMNFCRENILGLKELPHFLITDIDTGSMEDDSLLATMENIKKAEILAALEKCAGKRKAAAEILGISKSTLYRSMKKYDLL